MADRDVILRFDDFELTLAPLALRRHGAPVRARAQVLQLLGLLASRQGSLVTHAEIRRHLWNGRVVDFTRSVHVCVRQLREALGDDAAVPRYVETVPRQGYRFVAAVQSSDAAPRSPDPPRAMTARPRASRLVAGAGLACIAIASLVLAVVQIPDVPAPAAADPAHDAYLCGRHLLDRGDPAAIGRSVPFFLEALDLNARHAPSHASLAKAHRLLGRWNDSRRHAAEALAIAPSSAEAHLELAISRMSSDWDWDAAGWHLARALALDPQSAEARQAGAARFAILGEFDAARAEMARALELDPASTLLRADYGWFLYLAGDYVAAMARCREALEIEPRHFPSQACLARAAEAAGELEAAATAALTMMEMWDAPEAERAALRSRAPALALRAFHEWRLEFYRAYPDRSAIQPTDLADAHAAIGDFEAALGFLEGAATSATSVLPIALRDPIFIPLRRDARFRALLARLGLPVHAEAR